MHCDTITRLLYQEGQHKDASLLSNDLHIDLNKLIHSNYLVQNFAIFTNVKGVEDPLIFALQAIDKFYRELDLNQDKLKLILNSSDIDDLQKEHKIGALLTIEDASIVKGDLAILRLLNRLGVRMVGLTWNYITDIGYPNINMEANKIDMTHVDTKNGLTDFGKKLVEECERLKMIVDVSHLSDKGFWDVYEMSNQPFVASHSNARAICNIARNLDDDMIKALSHKGGVMGLNFCDDFISSTGSIKDIVAHVDHIVSVGGIDTVGLGSDFDGIPDRKELNDASKMQDLAKALAEHGYSIEDINKIMYQNVLRVYREIF